MVNFNNFNELFKTVKVKPLRERTFEYFFKSVKKGLEDETNQFRFALSDDRWNWKTIKLLFLLFLKQCCIFDINLQYF